MGHERNQGLEVIGYNSEENFYPVNFFNGHGSPGTMNEITGTAPGLMHIELMKSSL
jgi:hypothetical protein